MSDYASDYAIGARRAFTHGFDILSMLFADGGAHVSQSQDSWVPAAMLSEHLGISLQSLRRVMISLECAGWVGPPAIVVWRDREQYAYAITDRGAAALSCMGLCLEHGVGRF